MENKLDIFEKKTISLCAEKVCVSYKKTQVLKDIDLDASFSKITCIVGRNGAGKSTFLKALMGLISFDGKFIYNGNSLTKNILMNDFEYVPQVSLLVEDLTVKDNLILLTKNNRKFNISSFKKIENLLYKKVKELSIGQKRRVIIESAISNCPKFLVMDEPLAGLDFYYKDELLKRLLELKSEMGILMTTHQIEGVNFADKIYELDGLMIPKRLEDL